MTDEKILGMITGLEVAFIHLAEVLEKKGIVPRDELAGGLKATARDLPAASLTQTAQLILSHLAQGIEDSAGPDPVEARRQLLRLIQGGRPE